MTNKTIHRTPDGKPIMSEDTYRKKLRLTARILDYEMELKNVGYGQEYLDDLKKNPLLAKTGDKRLYYMLDAFTKKPTGYEQELLCLFDKYDVLLKNCKSDQERKAVGAMGVVAISKLLDDGAPQFVGGSLTVDGQSVDLKNQTN